MPRSRLQLATYRIEQMLDWQYGEKSTHRAFAEQIAAELTKYGLLMLEHDAAVSAAADS